MLLGFPERSEAVFLGEPAAGLLLCHPRVQRGLKARHRDPSARPWCPEGLGRNNEGCELGGRPKQIQAFNPPVCCLFLASGQYLQAGTSPIALGASSPRGSGLSPCSSAGITAVPPLPEHGVRRSGAGGERGSAGLEAGARDRPAPWSKWLLHLPRRRHSPVS